MFFRHKGWPFTIFLFMMLLAGTLIRPSSAFAQGGPPMITDDPNTPGTGHWENNFAFALDNTPTEHLFEMPVADLNYGWGERVQLRLEVPWLLVKTPNTSLVTGIGNISPGVKIRFLDEDSSGVNVSTYPSYRLNYTSISSIVGGGQFFLPVEISRMFGTLQIDAEVGFDYTKDEPGVWQYGVVAGYNASHAFQILAELHATSGTGALTELLANVGCSFRITNSLIFIGSAGKNLTPAGYDEYIAYAGLQLLIE